MEVNDPTCLIGYRLVNADMNKAIAGFIRIFESLYSNELKIWKLVNDFIIQKLVDMEKDIFYRMF